MPVLTRALAISAAILLFPPAGTAFAKGGGGEGNGCNSPDNKPETQENIKKAEAMGCKCSSGFRTRAQQAAAYARHGGRPGAAAKPGNSRHEQGLAFDCPTVIQCPGGFKRLENESHKGMSHCSDTGG